MVNYEEELNGLSEQEKELALKILKEYSDDGKSKTFTDILYDDYDDMPVDISTFLHDRKYLGNALYSPDGRFTLFPYWEEKLKEIFPTNIDTRYNTIILTGAIGLGKSTIAVICELYLLYRLLCLKDPYLYYGLQPIDKISISLMNITIENAKGVALDKMNQMILSSSWFMAHGAMHGTTNMEYVPEKHIELIVASGNNQVIGRAIFCLSGDTEVITKDGIYKLTEIQGQYKQFLSINKDGKLEYSTPCKVEPTKKTKEIYEVELRDRTIIRCTPDHRFLLKTGKYKEAQFLTEYDELASSTNDDSNEIKNVTKITLRSEEQMYDVIDCYPNNNFAIKTNLSIIFSHNCNFTDEVNFGLTNDVEKLKKKQKQLISQIDARMKSRFLRGTYLPTLNIIASSKNSDQSFLDSYIETKKKNESTTTLIVDEPQWVVDSRKDSEIHFYVAVGNKFLANELLPKDAPQYLVDEYRARGYSMLEVPIGYYENFQDNIDGALTDIAGISTASSLKYISGIRWNEIKTDSYLNPFTKEIIEVGTTDTLQYSDFFDLSKVDSKLKSKPLFIHLDMSKSGDKTGIGGVWIVGKRPKVDGEDSSRELFFKVSFHVSIKAPKGAEISFDKNRAFIRWLKQQGFVIKGISADTYQSAQIQQQLTADGFNVETISVDRLDSETKQCLPYAYLKSTIYDKRLSVYKDCDFLTEEVVGLERESDGHIQHPEGGTQGSKDAIDSITGSLWNASKHADEFAFEYGEDLDAVVDVSSMSSVYDKKQIQLDMEEMLKGFDRGIPSKLKADTPLLDFGMGIAQPLAGNSAIYLQNGIIV